jgi:hypothetical protein
MYQVLGKGWPCSACVPQDLKTKFPALAKQHHELPGRYDVVEHLKFVAHENEGLRKVRSVSLTCITSNTYAIFQAGQLLDNGTALLNGDHSYWSIVLDMRMISEPHLRHIESIIEENSDETLEKCREGYKDASNAALARMEWYVEKKGMLHSDVAPRNVLFDRELKRVEFVDWGEWIPQTVRAGKPLSRF